MRLWRYPSFEKIREVKASDGLELKYGDYGAIVVGSQAAWVSVRLAGLVFLAKKQRHFFNISRRSRSFLLYSNLA
jgi:hypothetical protein